MKALVLLAALQASAPAPDVTQQAAAYECTAEQAFGVKFGDSVSKYAKGQAKPTRGDKRFASYLIRSKFRSPKYDHYTVEADFYTGEIYSVKAWSPIDNVPPESEYDRLFVPEIRRATDQFSSANGINIPTPGRPPYSLERNGVDYSVWHDFYNGKLYYTYECLNKQQELSVQKRVLNDMLGESK